MKKWIILTLCCIITASTCITSTQANINAWNFFSQGTAINAVDKKKISNIQVLWEKLSIEFINKNKEFTAPSTPSYWMYFKQRNLEIPRIQDYKDFFHRKNTITPLFWGYTDRETGKYLPNSKIETNAHITAVYTMKNTSSWSIDIDSGFSFFDRMSSTRFWYESICSDYIGVDDMLMPQWFKVQASGKKIATSLEFIAKDLTSPCMIRQTDASDKRIFKKISWLFPVQRYQLSFTPYETKTISVEYDIHSFKYGAEYSFSDAIFYDFAPIYTWGNGNIPQVDIDVTYPAERSGDFVFGTNYRSAINKYHKYDITSGNMTANSDIAIPQTTKILSRNRIQQFYTFKNLQKSAKMDTLLFTFYELISSDLVDYSTFQVKTFGLSCTLPNKKVQIFKNLFPASKAQDADEFIWYIYRDHGSAVLINKFTYPQTVIPETTMLPRGTKCEKTP